ncbi:VOC family protein [Sedimenticola selenatireducens]|uniref:VOC domain-containing protein n=1 Tax=Sedimenticola selenatireducens TaxID=191960 RepID=A0A2N6CV69_9GAMM|nr:VOC family protein [Sedimenticola selenatireducens]PLX61106.1 MAG: hypothetical protein C0630_11940 [Sedimenticola selenatireducens]
MLPRLRVARPTSDLERSARMYREGLELQELGRFRDHDGFDGVMLGDIDGPYHLEFTRQPSQGELERPSPEALLVFYLPDPQAWQARCEKMLRAGFRRVTSTNPYWERGGCTFEDADGYRVVIHNSDWP